MKDRNPDKEKSTSVTISKKRFNGLWLRTEMENRKYASITLDTILRDAGVPELSDAELTARLKRLEREVIAT